MDSLSDTTDELCLCFHVPAGKIEKFIRLTQPRFVSQCSDCYGAGTGCGWCIPFIEQLFEQIEAGSEKPAIGMAPGEYRERRLEYLERLRLVRRGEEGERGGTLDDELDEEPGGEDCE